MISELSHTLILYVTPVLLWVDRAAMLALAVTVLIRCCRSLFGQKAEHEQWGFVSLSNGARYDLLHWENVIGRARSCDIRISFPSVSRRHAALCRDDGGTWRIYPINASAGILINGEHIQGPSVLCAGDCVSIGGVALYFFPANKDQEARLARNRTQPGHTVSPAVTLGYLSALQALTLVQFLPSFGGEYGALIPLAFGALCAMMWGLYFLYRLLRRAAFEAETLAFFLITLNFAVTAAYAPDLLRTQVAAVGLGIVIFLLLSFVLRNLRLSVKLRWPVAAAAAVLLAFNVLFGQQIFGAKNWIAVGSVSFQPSEFVKLAFILVGAATLDRLFARRNLIFTLVFSAYCVGCLALMSDFGTALVFFVAFLCIAFLRTGDLASLVMMAAAAVFAGGIVLRFKPYIAERFAVWRHAWEYTQSLGYQQSRTMSAIASGGLFGVGPENGWLKELGAANTDLVFGVLGEEFGLLLALCAILALIVLAVFTLESTSTARSSFYTIVSCAATAMLIFQTTLNVMGAVDLLPLTGVTFPFVSVGGSSMAACWGLLAFLKAADTRQNASFILRLPRKIRAARAKPLRDGERADADDLDALFARKPDIPVDEIFGKGGDGQ